MLRNDGQVGKIWSAPIGGRGITVLAILTVLFFALSAVLLVPSGLPLVRIPWSHLALYVSVAAACSLLLIGTDRIRHAGGLTGLPLAAGTMLTTLILLVDVSLLVGVAYWAVKPAITTLNPSHYDALLESIERAIFGGNLPSLWLIEKIHGRWLLLLDSFYHAFTPYLLLSAFVTLYYHGFPGGLRLTLATSLGLLLCLLISLMWPSWGPLFIHRQAFQELSALPGGVLADYLLQTVRDYSQQPRGVPGIAGIAAMPSYHVYAWACAALCWRSCPKPVFVAGILSCLLNWLCTVALGWHYALDGLVALALLGGMWPLSGVIATACVPKFPGAGGRRRHTPKG